MNEQGKKAKVIERLEHEVARTELEWLDCVEVALLRDALALLKAQEPRVMTLEEAVTNEVVFYEPRYPHRGITKGLSVFPVIRTVEPFSNRVEWYSPYFPEEKVHIMFAPDEYGVFGRCWTSRPTDAQREATPWPK